MHHVVVGPLIVSAAYYLGAQIGFALQAPNAPQSVLWLPNSILLGTLLVVPFRDVTDITELRADERADLMDEIIFGKELLKAALKPDAFNVGFNLGSAAGGSIPHLHAHIVPRWNGDTNFMPVIGQTRVLPQSLEAMYERLSAVAKSIKP